MDDPQGSLEFEAPRDSEPEEISLPRILSVGELNRRVRDLLLDHIGEVWVEGELSDVRYYGKGGGTRIYGSLKDAEAEARIVVWPEVAGALRFRMEDGLKVQVLAEVGLYVQRGQFQLRVLEARPAGIGELELAFQQLKERLEREGLFDPARKRPLPHFPFRVGVVTSLQGAALRDFLNVTRRRNPAVRILVAGARVQGEGAATEIVDAVRKLENVPDLDLIVLTRGGGSLEDLWPFNEEVLARAVASCRLPVLSAVGHETDWTISDMVADLRMPTPSAAAEHVAWPRDDWRQRIDEHTARIGKVMGRRVAVLQERVGWFGRAHGFRRMGMLLRESGIRVQDTLKRLPVSLRHRIDLAGKRLEVAAAASSATVESIVERHERRLEHLARTMNALGPMSVLQRGYAIVRRPVDGMVVRSTDTLKPDDPLEVYLREGKADVRVEATGPGLERLGAAEPDETSDLEEEG